MGGNIYIVKHDGEKATVCLPKGFSYILEALPICYRLSQHNLPYTAVLSGKISSKLSYLQYQLCRKTFHNLAHLCRGICLHCKYIISIKLKTIPKYKKTRSLGALRAPTYSWRPFGPLDFVLRALRALRPCDPRTCIHAACVHDVCIHGECINNAYIHDAYVRDSCIHDAFIHDAYTHDICTHGACMHDACIQYLYIHDAYTDDAYICDPGS